MKAKVLITGASGLLGRALVKEFQQHDVSVLAQYHNNIPFRADSCSWLEADFYTLEGVREFLQRNREAFVDCTYVINCYGPITFKDITELEAEDFSYDYRHNVVTAFEITRSLIGGSPSLKAVCSIGFEFTGEIKPYKKILTYAAAKNSLLLLTRSFESCYPGIRFNMINVPTLEGAEVPSKSGKPVAPAEVARKIYALVTGN